jgi:hypothetical protein
MNAQTNMQTADSQGDVNRFALLLAADSKLVEAADVLKRAGLFRNVGQVAALRASVARALNGLQENVYDSLAAE